MPQRKIRPGFHDMIVPVVVDDGGTVILPGGHRLGRALVEEMGVIFVQDGSETWREARDIIKALEQGS